ncbi:MAG: Flp pilus assembly protein CpaB [Chloroflexi bacterium]|nr:Flp pilus assembly protein CpaB [Chloroflexota bacterium]
MIKTGAFKSTGNKWLLFTGLALAVISAALVFVYLRSAGDEGGSSSGSSGARSPVLVAAQDISAGSKITSEMLAVKSVVTTDVLTGAFSEVDDLVGQITLVPIVTGEQVIGAKVVGGDSSITSFGSDPPVSLVIPEGMRAVSASVSNVAAVGGLVRPGDYVDIILAVQVEESTGLGENTIATTFMQNVQLIALDQDVTVTTIGETAGAGAGGVEEVITGSSPGDEVTSPGAGTATFIVEPVHAEVLALANLCAQHYNGSLIISLRGLGDEGAVANRTTYATDGPPPDCAALFSGILLP